MKRGLLVFLAMCALTTAMVPRYRRAVNSEEEEEIHQSPSTIATDSKLKCARQTPCAWSIYKPNKYIEMNITNEYCECGPGMVCRVTEDDSTASALVHRCRSPEETEDATES